MKLLRAIAARRAAAGRGLRGPWLAAALGVVALAGCAAEGAGACGEYVETPGTARITTVGPAPEDEPRCAADPVKVLFDFAPDDPGRAPLAATGAVLTVGDGKHPPRAWVEASGLAVGSEHRAVRADQGPGPCPPAVFVLAAVDYDAASAACGAPASHP